MRGGGVGRAAIYKSRGGAPQGEGGWTMGSGLLGSSSGCPGEGIKTRGIIMPASGVTAVRRGARSQGTKISVPEEWGI